MNNTHQTSQSLSVTDRQKKCLECKNRQEELQSELKQINKDLADARKKGDPTGSIYTEKQRIDDKIKLNQMDIEMYCENITSKEPGNDNQTIISSSSVRKKTAKALQPINNGKDNK